VAGGRPTKYNPDLLKEAQVYLDGFLYGDEEGIPSIAGLALALGITRETCRDWNNQAGKKEFSVIIKGISLKQESILLNKGLSGESNPMITKLVLSKHGYHDRVQTELTGKDGCPVENKWIVEVVGVTDAKD